MIRLGLIIFLLLIALLAIFKAPEYHLWLLAIAVTEFPLVFTAITLLLLFAGFIPQRFQLAGTVIGVVALLLYLSPIAREWIVAKNLKQEMSASLREVDTGELPFSLSRLFSGSGKQLPHQTFVYVTYPDTTMKLDYYHSQVSGKRPCVIIVHGGSWAGGDSQQLPELNTVLATSGYNVASINYRMAPKYQSPAPVADVKATLTYLRQHANSLQIDTNNFVLLGRSAGAQIALLAAYTLHDKGLKGVIDFYGPADMVWGYSIPSNPLIMDSRKVMEDYLGGTYNSVPQNYKNSSPLEFADKQAIPTLIIHGHNDVLVAYEHSRRLNEKLQQNGIKHYWLRLPWATHGFDYNINGPGGQLSTYAVEYFLSAITTP